MRINTNVLALNSARNLSANSSAVQSNIEKLSSGLRINRAADDAAGLIISEGMRAQIAGIDQAIRNSNDGINMIKTAEGALNEVHSLLRSMRTLAVHAANSGVNSADAVAADQAQLDSAVASISRIGTSTQFNGKFLLTGALGVTGTSDNGGNVQFLSGTAGTESANYSVTASTVATQRVATFGGVADYAGGTSSITINNVLFQSKTGESYGDFVTRINSASDQTGVTATSSGATDLVLTNVNYGAGTAAPVVNVSGGTFALGAVTASGGADATATVAGLTFTADAADGRILTASNGLKLQVVNGGAATIGVANNAAEYQVGANAGQTAKVNIDQMDAAKLGVQNLNLQTAAGARAAIGAIDAAIGAVSSQRSALGSFQKNVLESNVNSLGVAKENLSASESTIRDTDMAAEMVNFTKNQILVQASQAMLAQANQSSQSILQLLRG